MNLSLKDIETILNIVKVLDIVSRGVRVDKQYEHYSMMIQWSVEDNAYLVTVPELPDLMTHGETYEEAVLQGQDAIQSWIDANIAWGRPIPKPRVLDIDAT